VDNSNSIKQSLLAPNNDLVRRPSLTAFSTSSVATRRCSARFTDLEQCQVLDTIDITVLENIYWPIAATHRSMSSPDCLPSWQVLLIPVAA